MRQRTRQVHDEQYPSAERAGKVHAPRVGQDEEAHSDPRHGYDGREEDKPPREPGLPRDDDVRDPGRGNDDC